MELKVSVSRTMVENATIVITVSTEDADDIHKAVVKAVQEDNLRAMQYINWELDSNDIEVNDYESV